MKSSNFFHFLFLFLLCYLVHSVFPLSVGSIVSVEPKDWSEYTSEEKKALRERWTEKQVDAVIKALKANEPLPEYWGSRSTDERKITAKEDLRGIPLSSMELKNVKLDHVCLQGAILMSCSFDSADLSYANLQGVCLQHISLQGTVMESTDLQYAWLWNADLEGAWLRSANLQYAHLRGANLRDALVWDANLQHSDLARANFKCSKLGDAYLENANLYHTVFDSTYLWRVNLGNANNIRYIIWGDNIKPRYIIGEEIEAESQPDSIKQEFFQRAELTYRDLKTWYENVKLYDVARKFHYRENEVITKASPWIVKLLRVLFLKWTFGYGSNISWIIRYSIVIVLLFSNFFVLLSFSRKASSALRIYKRINKKSPVLLNRYRTRFFLECLYFSLLSFVHFGYGVIKPKSWLEFFRRDKLHYEYNILISILRGVEALIGIWIFALLVTVLFGK